MVLRHVTPEDIAIFYRQQLEPEGIEMAAFPARDRASHFAHWTKILEDPSVIARAVVVDDEVAGNVVSWVNGGTREVGYWIGRDYWGKGIATSALRQFIALVDERPLLAWVAKGNAASARVLQKCGFEEVDRDATHLIYKLDRQVPQ